MSSHRINTTQQLRDAYRQTRDQVAEAAIRSGRKPSEVLMVAVTKTASPDQIRTLVEMGQEDFAENRVQHLIPRVAQLDEFLARRRLLGRPEEQGSSPPTVLASHHARSASTSSGAGGKTSKSGAASVRWHMIGHLQRNKIKLVVPLVRLIHSVDSLRLAEELHALGARTERVIDILIQVNASGEENKFGIAPPAVIHLAEQLDSMLNLRLRGLMTMAPYSENPGDSRPTFARTAELFAEIRSGRMDTSTFNILSMGMSDDFEVAISEGANVVRIGRALFGDAPADDDEEPQGPGEARRIAGRRIAEENQDSLDDED